jgi:hypothetical protein
MIIEDNVLMPTYREYEVLNLIKTGKSQTEIAAKIRLSRPRVNQITKTLLSYNLIKRVKFGEYSSDQNYRYSENEVQMEIIVPEKPQIMPCRYCANCKKPLPPGSDKRFCDLKCKGEFFSGPNSPGWKGGKTFKPYCYKFNRDLKRRVREYFNYECFACGAPQSSETGTLMVHHVLYNRMACCDGGGEPLFIPLCMKCHNTTSHSKNQEFWKKLFYHQLMKRTGGKCYFTKREDRERKRLSEVKE